MVPFRPQLFSKLSRDENGELRNPTFDLFSDGMRIFDDFGPHIRRFALSLEVDEDVLSYPPAKPLQEVVPAFWGLYRWPHEDYNRYSDLAGLERTADETDSMKVALRTLSKVSELGLCCDAGLGFLYGPDRAARTRAPRSAVFARQDWQKESRREGIMNHLLTLGPAPELTDQNTSAEALTAASNYSHLLRMAHEAGYSAAAAEEAIEMLLVSEGTSLEDAVLVETSEPAANPAAEPAVEPPAEPPAEIPPELAANLAFNAAAELRDSFDSSESEEDIEVTQPSSSSKPPEHPLIPNALTTAQKEFLLELEWAHRAMIQSYVIGLTDVALEGRFEQLSTLTIAKIPSSHLTIFHDSALWESLPNLRNVSLGVVADWRSITRPNPTSVVNEDLSPLRAIPAAYTVLNDYIGQCKNIESLHFEWICGGELATSSHQRNQFIMPAPFCPDANNMANPTWAISGEILQLPHIRHLSLKNCWMAPHIAIQFFRQMGLSSLRKIELESVSLSGPPTTQAISLNIAPPPGFVGLWFGGAGIAAAQEAHEETIRRQKLPYLFSWNGFLEQFSPTLNTTKILEKSGISTTALFEERLPSIQSIMPDAASLHSERSRYMIKSVSITSCGYIAIDTPHLDTRLLVSITSDYAVLQSAAVTPLQDPRTRQPQDLTPWMQNCKDKLLGRILTGISRTEIEKLNDVFHMKAGWDGIYGHDIVDSARADGYELGGIGRISGTLEAELPSEE